MADTEPNPRSQQHIRELRYLINHVFLPPELPQKYDEDSAELQLSLAQFAYKSAVLYVQCLPLQEQPRWNPILRMLENIAITSDPAALSKTLLEKCIKDTQDGDISAFFVRAQNAGLIMRRSSHVMTFEMFEVSPRAQAVIQAKGKLRCSYPGPAITVPLSVVSDPRFLTQFVSFLETMDSGLPDVKDTAHPQYITEMLTGILRGLGEPANIKRICKRIGDDVLGGEGMLPWRRSPLWLLIRVALQTSLDRDAPTVDYKSFGLFLTSRILCDASEGELDSDILSIMRGKISRRLQKIGSGVDIWLLKEVTDAVEKVKTQLEKRWEDLQNIQREPRILDLKALDPAKDSSLSLSKSREFLMRMLQPVSNHALPSMFKPSHFPRLQNIRDFGTLSTNLPTALSTERYLALLDFEYAVEHYLDSWVSAHLQDSTAPSILAGCMHQYLDAAQEEYRSGPEDLSLMILTAFELWVALDRIAVVQCPLLKRYSPEVDATLLQSLLLSKSNPLRRLASIEKYLAERHSQSERVPSIFSDDIKSLSFSVQFFQQSVEHQLIFREIQTQADKDRKAKVEELHRRNNEHNELTDRARGLEHHYHNDRWGARRHSNLSYCSRCQLESRAQQMRISVHEWPLPASRMDAEAVVFELNLPLVFGVWRTTTYYLLHDVCTPQDKQSSSQANPPERIDTYQPLQPFFRRSERIMWASSERQFFVARYGDCSLPTTEYAICVDNCLRYRLFDKEHCEWAAGRFKTCDIAHFCTLKISPGPYQYLQYTVKSTSHTSNDVLASQSKCPAELTIHEHMAFVGLRSGHRLQWLNVLRELRSRCLRFGQEPVSVLLTQATSQVGPPSPGNGDREYHKDLSDRQYACALLKELRSLLGSIEESWLEGDTARVIILLTSRLLASNTDSGIADMAYALLRRVRDVTFSWIAQLVQKPNSNNKDATSKIQSLTCKLAATCKATYDFDKCHLTHLLCSAQDFAVLVQCDNIVHKNTPAPDLQTPYLKRVLGLHRRLSHALEMEVVSSQMFHIGLDNGIKALWSAFENAGSWIQLDRPDDRWFYACTPETSGHRSQVVHYNILDGQLRVDGNPLGRLPPEILAHPMFTRIFGKSQQTLEVVPSDIPGMEFATPRPVFGYMIHFKLLTEDKFMSIRAVRSQDVFELIPHDILKEDIPKDLVSFYAHWFNLQTGEIEFRPLDKPWDSSDDNWRMQFRPTGHSHMSSNGTSVVDIRSQTFSAISSVLSPIEHAQHLKVLHSPADNLLSVNIYRYNLSFIVRNGKLECQNYRGMVVDPNQYVGTLFGLRNMLVLCPSEPNSFDSRRMVLIPSGNVHIQREAFHVSIGADLGQRRRVQYHTYKIDTELGCLTECASLESSLFKIYLHAITSHCLPDPLTRQTGTEEAIYGLCSSATWSFRYLERAEVELLETIGSLTPRRDYTPPLKCMQQVQWCKLHSSAQHGRYYRLTNAILQYASQLKLFHPDSFDIPRTSRGSIHLLERSERRNVVLYPEELADSELSDSTADTNYQVHDVLGRNTHEAFVAGVVYKLHHPGSHFNINRSLLAVIEKWSRLEGPDESHYHRSCTEWLGASFPESWLSLYNLCQRNRDPYGLSFTLSALAYSSDTSTLLIETLIAFATFPDFHDVPIPPYRLYTLSDGYAPAQEALRRIIGGCANPVEANKVTGQILCHYGESDSAWAERQSTVLQATRDLQISRATDWLTRQWPRFIIHYPRLEPMPEQSLLCLSDVQEEVQILFNSCYKNVQLRQCIHASQDILNRIHEAKTIELPRYHFLPSLDHHSDHPKLSINLLFARAAPEIPLPPPVLGAPSLSQPSLGLGPALQKLVSEFVDHPTDSFVQSYGCDLKRSCQAFKFHSQTPSESPYSHHVLKESMHGWKSYVDQIQAKIRDVLEPHPGSPIERVAFDSGLWPRLTLRSLLRSLSAQRVMALSQPWKTALISLGKALTNLHRAQRLVALAFRGQLPDLFKELGNTGYENWDVESYPDWLLIQVENRILLRANQARVALEMILPQSKGNTVMQLNMGEGKSSVIIPMISAALADSTRLVRVVILKPLAPAMFQLLVQRLGGLTNRRIYSLPFSRSFRLDESQVDMIESIWEECLRNRGIFLVQPEHLLSFKLMGIEQLHVTSGLATRLMKAQCWLEQNTRDILDESDEILSVRYQLIYAMGTQQPVEDHPDRWATMQEVLSLVKEHSLTPYVRDCFDDIEVLDSGRGTFPQVRILSPSAGHLLSDSIVESVQRGDLSSLKLHHLPRPVCQAAISFIKRIPMSSGMVEKVKRHFEGTAAWKTMLLLRGLLAQGILVFMLKEKRWRVDYGLDPKRSLLAVPYRAKDNPSPRAEFGHPDITLGLTCLSYYYGGLSDKQVEECFQILLGLDNPALEYGKWVAEIRPSLPEGLRELGGVNPEDPQQLAQSLIPLFRLNHSVINFFLAQVVFPKQAKQFPHRLGTSSWDIAMKKKHLTTGFSGTNDNRYLLPLPISQGDRPEQLGTNAMVLDFLLQPENDHYLCIDDESHRLAADHFLDVLVTQRPPIRMLLDAGAQMLEFRNRELVKRWLLKESHAQAAIFFDDDDELRVLGRDGRDELFSVSPFNTNLDQCLVYLDDVHTRGTDLKLPAGTRGAVTLGAKLSKDRLMQACLRLRKLGSEHSVMFFAPPDIDQKIRCSASNADEVHSLDILRWAMLETHAGLKNNITYWAQQGLEYKSRMDSWSQFSEHTTHEELLDRWLQREAKTLDEMYGLMPVGGLHPAFQDQELRKRCLSLGVSSFRQELDEEQERELALEVEQEQQIERPRPTIPAKHSLHPDVCHLVESGVLAENSLTFRPAFPNSDVGQYVWSNRLFVTRDFTITIESHSNTSYTFDDYMRPVHWILSTAHGFLVILSPFEVNELLPRIRTSTKVFLHIYTPRITEAMKSSEDFNFFTLPSPPRSTRSQTAQPPRTLVSERKAVNQLNLFAGQLYLRNYQTYLDLCEFLGVICGKPEEQPQGVMVQLDGFMRADIRQLSPFKDSPLPYLKMLVGFRRKGQSFKATDIWSILHTKVLTEDTFSARLQVDAA